MAVLAFGSRDKVTHKGYLGRDERSAGRDADALRFWGKCFLSVK